jgi:hypothetical protein
MIDEDAATELKIYIDNDGDLYRRQTTSILKNLATKKARGEYKHDLAVKAFGYLVEAGAKKYAKEFGSPDQPWHQMFDAATRRAVAEKLTKDFEGEYALGNYDRLLPKKYQKEMQQYFEAKASPKKYVSAMPDFPKRPPGTALAERIGKKSEGHARKKIAWRLPEGLVVAWAPANQAYFALWPAGEPLRDQQVLKIADADEMDAWLRETYGHPYGRAGSHASHSRRRMSGGRHEAMHDPVVLRSSTDRQLRSFYADEKQDVARARAEAHRRGFELHATKKSASQLDREIAAHVPAWRRGGR